MNKYGAAITAFFLGSLLSFWFASHYQIKNNQLTKIPSAILADGALYAGNYNEQGLMEGEGTLSWPNGAYYEGGFKSGLFHGKGIYTDGLGYRYEGSFVEGFQTGSGRVEYSDGVIYEGELVNNRMHGHGKIIYEGGDSYEGDFQNDNITGQGRWEIKNDYVYTGEVEKSFFHGQGNIVYENGSSYTGEFLDGEFHGRGVFQSVNGLIYSGEFVAGSFEGFGSIVNRETGRSYVGEIKTWVPHGQGIVVERDGSQKKGNFEHGKIEGEGILIDRSGNRYEGEFRVGEKHGKGIYTFQEPVDGVKSFAGTWRYGDLISGDEKYKIFSSEEITEYVLYNQQQAVETAINQLSSGDENEIELYVLGVAPYGSQEVFRREINYIEQFFNQQYSLDKKAIYLSNSRREIRDRPLATITSLETSVNAIAEKMNREQDILFLYITSHGSQDKEISFNHKGLVLKDLSAEKLNQILVDAKIKWKVIVLSACYSGGFIDDLKNDNTLIITAAAFDKQSFGCEDTNEFTYFGEAYFKQALAQTESFIDAFDVAKEIVAEQEKAQDYEQSDPQIHKPQAIIDHLKKWQATRQSNSPVEENSQL